MSGRMKGAALLALLVLLVFAGRMLLLHYSEFVYDEEEYKTGSIAYLIMHGPPLPLLEYQPGDYEGGTLLFGLLMIPFFAVFGPNYLALKLLAIATTLVMAVVAAWFARRHGGWAAAVATGALFVLPAPYIFQVGLLPWGNYAENAMLTAVTLLLASSLLANRRRGPFAFLLFGLLLGLGVWMHYGFLVAVLTVAVLWWIIDFRSIFSQRGLGFAVGFAAGFSPWIVYNATHNWWGVGRFADAFGKSAGVGARLSAFGRRFVLLWTEDLPAGLHFHASSLATVKAVSYFYYAVTLALAALLIVLTRSRLRTMAVALWPRARRAAADADFWLLAPVAYVALYALVYSYSDYGLFARQWGSMDPETHCHIFALYPPLLLIGGLAVGRAWTTKWRWAGAAAVVALVLGGGFGYAQMLSFSRPESGRLSRAAYDLNVIYMEIGSKWGADPQQVQRLERQLSGPPLRAFLFGVGIKYGLDHAKSLAVALDECAVQPDHLLPYCWFGIGTGLYAGSTLPPEQLDAVLGNAPERVRPWLVLGSCVGSIWTGHAEYHTCQDAARIYVPAIAPPPEARALQVFVWGHLVMGQFRPAKQ